MLLVWDTCLVVWERLWTTCMDCIAPVGLLAVLQLPHWHAVLRGVVELGAVVRIKLALDDEELLTQFQLRTLSRAGGQGPCSASALLRRVIFSDNLFRSKRR